MPFLEIYHFNLEPQRRRDMARDVTDGLAAAFSISPDIITTYFHNCGPDDYAHAGVLPAAPEARRMFVKVHAFPRPADRLRDAAGRITDAVAANAPVGPENIAVYFLPRDPQEAAHAGRLVSDGEAPLPTLAAAGSGARP
ncbi:hypothetical protein STVA_11540 [Allostella vacuolata]|nr:hypothetical protein STVA_11540 [Stella vacuolata]